MKKATDSTQPQPAAAPTPAEISDQFRFVGEQILVAPPQQVKTVVSFKATIPTQQYGNIEMFVSQEIYNDADTLAELRHERLEDTLDAIKASIAEIVLPLACAEVERARSELVKQPNPDVWMQLKNPLYRWLRVAQPDLVIPPMEALMLGKQPAITE